METLTADVVGSEVRTAQLPSTSSMPAWQITATTGLVAKALVNFCEYFVPVYAVNASAPRPLSMSTDPETARRDSMTMYPIVSATRVVEVSSPTCLPVKRPVAVGALFLDSVDRLQNTDHFGSLKDITCPRTTGFVYLFWYFCC